MMSSSLCYQKHSARIKKNLKNQRHLVDIVEDAYIEDVITILAVANTCHTRNDPLLTKCIEIVARSNLESITIEKELPLELANQIFDFRSKFVLERQGKNTTHDINDRRIQGAPLSPIFGKGKGDATLADLMLSKDFPYNVERMIFGEVEKLPKGIERENRIIQTIMRQILFTLDGLHSTGIVHRDIKPQNIIFSQKSRAFKIIDLGAAADLRVGINYVPKEFLLDPSAGLIFLQMAFPSLRNDSNLIQFNCQLKRCRYDMVAWRESVEPRASPEPRRGVDLIDLDGGIGWEFLLPMM